MKSLRTTPRSCKPARTTRLAVQPLEDRSTPAAHVYDAATQTLTVTAANNDQLFVEEISGAPTGYFKVKEGMSVLFDCNAEAKSIRNLVFDFDGVDEGELTLGGGVRLGSNLKVLAAKDRQFLTSDATIGGNVTYTAPPGGGWDKVTFFGATSIGGNLNLGLRGGFNQLRLAGGTIGGTLTVVGGSTVDEIELVASTDLFVNGAASLDLGGGFNRIDGISNNIVRIGKSLTYVGGSGDDKCYFESNDTRLEVGGNLAINVGDAAPSGFNHFQFHDLEVGGNHRAIGGASADYYTYSGLLSVSGNFTARLGDGDNYFDLDDTINLLWVGGSLAYNGGAGYDRFFFGGGTIGKNLTVALGENDSAFAQVCDAGQIVPGGLRVMGSIKITDGAGDVDIALSRLFVGNTMTLTTGGGNDDIFLNDTNVAGATLMTLGAGADRVFIEHDVDDPDGNPLNGATTFGGKFTVRAGAGNDEVDLSHDGDSSTLVRFGGKLALSGGDGGDVLKNLANEFWVTGNFCDFEVGGVP